MRPVSGREAARQRLIVALDLPSAGAALATVERLAGRVPTFKIGKRLFTAEGPAIVRAVMAAGARVFLDLKYHDIPNTAADAACAAADLGVFMFNVHCLGGPEMLSACTDRVREQCDRAGRPRPLVIGVTVLTSMNGAQLTEIGLPPDPAGLVERYAQLARRCGLDGVVASPLEVGRIKAACGPGFVCVTPGVRPAGAAGNDQARIATPGGAAAAGADYLVLGRPVLESKDPVAAVEAVVDEIAGALI